MAHTRIGHDLTATVRGHRAGVSLHSHTHHSREQLGSLPDWLATVPLLGALTRRELNRQERRRGFRLNFSQAYWCPPLPPLGVIASEERQIADRLNLEAFVSITDHDNIDAALGLAAMGQGARYPMSVEWTVPYRGQVFHLGVHNLPSSAAVEFAGRFRGYTAAPSDGRLTTILADVTSLASVLVVLNHPLWNAHINATAERAVLTSFVRRCRPFLHATELNGYRSHAENKAALAFGRAWDLPVVAGGDRHGRAPNAMVNVTGASSFEEFVSDVRVCGRSEVLIMPEYRDHPAARVVEVIADVLRDHAHLDPGQRRWLQRVFVIDTDGQHRPLEHYWHEVPSWLRVFVRAVSRVGCDTARQAIRFGLPVENGGIL